MLAGDKRRIFLGSLPSLKEKQNWKANKKSNRPQ